MVFKWGIITIVIVSIYIGRQAWVIHIEGDIIIFDIFITIIVRVIEKDIIINIIIVIVINIYIVIIILYTEWRRRLYTEWSTIWQMRLSNLWKIHVLALRQKLSRNTIYITKLEYPQNIENFLNYTEDWSESTRVLRYLCLSRDRWLM